MCNLELSLSQTLRSLVCWVPPTHTAGLYVNNRDSDLLSVLRSTHLLEDPLVSAVAEVTSVICTSHISYTGQQGSWLCTLVNKVACNAGMCLTLRHRELQRISPFCSHLCQTLSIHISCGKLQISESTSIDRSQNRRQEWVMEYKEGDIARMVK